MVDDIPGYLEHYGILGMKWGVRRNRAELRRARGKKEWEPEKVSEDANRARSAAVKAKKGGVAALSNQELQQLNNRINLEQQYQRLTTAEKKKVNAGGDYAKKLMTDLAKEQTKQIVKQQTPNLIKLGLTFATPLDFTKIKL